MRRIFVVGLFLTASLQIDARVIQEQAVPKVIKDTTEQTYFCAMKLGPKIANVPVTQGIEPLPEDNAALNEMWQCIWEQKGVVDDEGDIVIDELYNYLTDLFAVTGKVDVEYRDLAMNVALNCRNDVENDENEHTAVKLQNCIIKGIIK